MTLQISDGGAGQVGTLVEIDCETDFVAKGEPFQALAEKVLAQAVKIGADNPETLLASEIEPGTTVQQVVDQANAAIGEKIVVSKVARVEGAAVTSYVHRTNPDLPPQIGVLVAYEGSDETIARDVAMHIAAMSPTVLTREEIAADDRRRPAPGLRGDDPRGGQARAGDPARSSRAGSTRSSRRTSCWSRSSPRTRRSRSPRC